MLHGMLICTESCSKLAVVKKGTHFVFIIIYMIFRDLFDVVKFLLVVTHWSFGSINI